MKRVPSDRIEGLRDAAFAAFGIRRRPDSPPADAAIQAALKESEERLRLATAAAGIGTFTVDLEAGLRLLLARVARDAGPSNLQRQHQ